MRTYITRAGVVLALALTGFFAVQAHLARSDVAKYREAARRAGLYAENATAMAAENYRVADQWRQRAMQVEVERDSLAQELEERPVVETVVVLDPDPAMIDAGSEDIADEGEAVVLNFEDEWLTAEVEYRPVDVTASIRYDLKPIRFTVGARCGAIDPASGVRPAIITIDQGQAPLEITIEHAEIDPEVCNAAVEVVEDGGFDLKSAGLGALGVIATILLIGD